MQSTPVLLCGRHAVRPHPSITRCLRLRQSASRAASAQAAGSHMQHHASCFSLFSPHWHPSTTHLPSPRQPYIMGRWACSASLPRSARRLQPDPGDRSQGPAQVALGRQPSQTTRTLIHVEVPCPGWVPGRRALGVCSLVHGRPSRSRAGRSLSGDMTHPRDHISEPYRSC